MKKGILILAALGMTLQLCAQVPRWTSQAWAAAQAELKKAVPQKYAEIEKLQSVNMLAAMEKLRELAREENIQFPDVFPRFSHDGGAMGQRMRQPQTPHRGTADALASTERKLHKERPAEYREIERLRAEADLKVFKLAAKAGIRLPDSMEIYRKKLNVLRIYFPQEYRKARELQRTDAEGGAKILRGLAAKLELGLSDPPGKRNAGNASLPQGDAMIQLRKRFPEEMKKLDKLKHNAPVAYRQQLRKLMEKMNAENKGK